ncbi:transcription antitermination factor NusB [Kerstersia gyiorum]|uniref:transcription antitermination factor NusB n=1 Tax=Kerstersia gyiorum TaxID=206506 RepID=UPI0039E79478
MKTRKKILTNPRTIVAEQASGRSARRRAREFALQGIYAWLVRGDQGDKDTGSIDAHLRSDPEFGEADFDWYRTLLNGVFTDAADLREKFQPFIDRPLAELSPVEHGILLIGTFELTRHPEVPYKVAINEAVELAKSFGGTDGFKFVNGVLDKLAAVVRPQELRAAPRR